MERVDLKKYIFSGAMSDGSFRGLCQVPRVLGVSVLLYFNGMSPALALSSAFFCCVTFSLYFSFILEILCGFLSQRLGRIGSFTVAPIGLFLRALSFCCFASVFYIKGSSLIVWSVSSFVLLGELGRALMSGAFEDSYRQLANYESGEKSRKNQVAHLDIIIFKTRQLFRVMFAFLGTLAVINYAISKSPTMVSLAFLTCSILIFYSFFVTYKALNWAKKNIKSADSGTNESFINKNKILNQLRFFLFERKDFLWSLGIASSNFLFCYVVNFSPLTLTDFLITLPTNSAKYSSSFYMCFVSALIPLALFLGAKFLLPKESEGKNNLFNLWSKKLGMIILIACSCICFVVLKNGPWNEYTLAITFFLGMMLSPIWAWMGWMRVPIAENAERELGTREFSGNHSFYYSLVEGFNELSLAIMFQVSGIFVDVGNKDLYLLMIFFSISCLFLWKINRKKPVALDLNYEN